MCQGSLNATNGCLCFIQVQQKSMTPNILKKKKRIHSQVHVMRS